MDKKCGQHKLEGRILAIDYGERRIGLAVSDPLYITAQGLDTLTKSGKINFAGEIARICGEYGVGRIVIGLPLTMAGKKSTAAERVAQFADELKKVVNIPIDFLDERLTSVAAKRALTEMGYKTGHRKELVDRTAAILLLQSYLDGLHQRAEE